MKIALDTAIKYADAADRMYDQLYRRRCELKREPICGSPGSIGYRTVAEVIPHLRKREDQINTLVAEIADLESTDADSDKVLEIADRLGLFI